MDIGRRSFLLAGAAVAARAAVPLTAGLVVERIKQNVGIPWRSETVDTIVAGSPDIVVKGIATTMMATLDVIQRSAAAGKNLVITHEPTYYLHQDKIGSLADDAVYRFKADFIREHEMAVFHFHDHWHARHPDGIATGMARELGWEKTRTLKTRACSLFRAQLWARSRARSSPSLRFGPCGWWAIQAAD